MELNQPEIKIGTHGKVSLYDVYPDRGTSLDMEIVAAARTSYNGESKGPEKDLKLLEYLIQNKHDSPLEMVDLTFMVEAPLVVWWQWVRHRTFSYNFQSGRYTPFDEDRVLVPTEREWRLQDNVNKQGSDGTISGDMGWHFTSALELHYEHSFRLYQEMLDAGIAREQARLCLPGFALFYRARVKANLRNWLHFLSLRNEDHAQMEIQEYARAVEEVISQVAPHTIQMYKKHRI